jgi:hypothetical protein
VDADIFLIMQWPATPNGQEPGSQARGGLLSGAASGDLGCSKVGAKTLTVQKLDSVRQRTDTTIRLRSNQKRLQALEINMIIGGGLLGTILLVAIIVYFLRRT